MVIENSDKYFMKSIRPLITKAEMNKRLRPLGLEAIGRGRRFGKHFIEVYVRVENHKYHGLLRVVFSGSDYTENDQQLSVQLYAPLNGFKIDDDAKQLSGRPLRDAQWMMNEMTRRCKCAAEMIGLKNFKEKK